MQIKIDDKDNVILVTLVGTIDDGIDVDDIPNEVLNNFDKYKYVNNIFVLRDDLFEKELEKAKENKINQMSEDCSNAIYNGMDIKLSNGTEHFTLTDNDRLNILTLSTKLGFGALRVLWCRDSGAKYYSALEAAAIISSLTGFEEYHMNYLRELKAYINSLTDIDEINTIEYGVSLPNNKKSQILKKLEAALDSLSDRSRLGLFSKISDFFN